MQEVQLQSIPFPDCVKSCRHPLSDTEHHIKVLNTDQSYFAREQAASCQRVIGGLANIAKEYATKRYRSNVMNWGMLPFLLDSEPDFEVGDYIFVPNIKKHLRGDMSKIPAYIIGENIKEISLSIAEMTDAEKSIVEAGSLINYNKSKIK